MPTIHIRNGLLLKDVPSEFLDELAEKLRAVNDKWITAKRFSPYAATQIDQYKYFCWASGSNVRTTRGFPLSRMSDDFKTWFRSADFVDERQGKRITCDVKMQKKFSLNAEQRLLLDNIMDAAERKRAGNLLVLASTSVGKTLLQAAAALKLGYKTLVLCPTDLILEAWLNDLLKFYGLERGDPRLGIIKQAQWSVGEFITLASLRIMSLREDRLDDLYKEIGTLVVDEVHKIAAPTTVKLVDQFPGKYILGATATQLKDGRPIPELTFHFGKPVGSVDTSHKETSTSMPISRIRKVVTAFQYDQKAERIDWADLCQHLSTDEDRNQQICNEIYCDWKAGKTILAVTRTHTHVEMLHEMLTERGIPDVNRLTGKTNPNKAYTRSLIRAINNRQCRCTIASLSAISTGANIRALDCLHVVIPPVSTDLTEQLFGRLRRKHDEHKQDAEVVWYLDSNVDYLRNRVFEQQACSVFRKMKIKGYV